ncbi:protein kinase domain-containing protein [Roseiconus nitratireducens]|nr:protein kinase [Roseiconus nitratireducens]
MPRPESPMDLMEPSSPHLLGKVERCTMESKLPVRLGIWRLGTRIHRGRDYSVARAQPIDASRSPRWDYVLKFGSSENARLGIAQSIAAGASLSHPNLVPVLDGDALAETPFLVMPLLEGQTMGWHLTHGPGKPLPVALWLIRQLCQALNSMHSAGWTHGDVKPDNLIVGSNGHVTLVDFAFAHEGLEPRGSAFRGTPTYAAPELLREDAVKTAACDIFSAGRILWEWLSRVETANDLLLRPVCELVERMVDDSPGRRPSAFDVSQRLLRMEIDSLGEHIGPQPVRRAA